MAILSFPPVEEADEETGLLAIGGDLEVESLLLAYSQGIFPWPWDSSGEIPWFSPTKRAILFFEDFSPGERLLRYYRNSGLVYKIDCDVEEVIRQCAASTRGGKSRSTWITKEMQESYLGLHEAGYCHAVGAYRDGKLVGGIYGVSIGKMFAAESMFYLESNASKCCLVFLVQYLESKGAAWVDCQQQTPLLKRLGSKEISRKQFKQLLRDAVDCEESMFKGV